MKSRRVIIVGSGVAGALVSERLLAKDGSVSILMLEAGPHIVMRNRRMWQDMVTAGADPYKAHQDSDSDAGDIVQTVTMQGARLFGRGGTTAHWYGYSFRFKPEDFHLRANTGREIDWPFGYETLEPYYHQAELAMGVAGDSVADDPPRKGKPYPFAAPPFVAADGPVVAAFEARGISYGHLPIARSGNCVTTGTCVYCPVGGKYSADLTLDELESGRGFELRVNAPVLRVLLNNKRSIAGVEYMDMATRTRHRELADEVVICAGAFETPKLLLASAEANWTEGLGNATGHVGRHPKVHDILFANGVLPRNPQRLRHELDIPTLCTRHWDTPKEQRDGKFFFISTNLKDYPAPLSQMMAGGTSAAELDAMGEGPLSFSFFGHRECFSFDGDFVKLASGTNRFGLPKMEVRYTTSEATRTAAAECLTRMRDVFRTMGAGDIRSEIIEPIGTYHFAGTTRMSKRAADGVVDENLTVHEIENLHLCSNAVFPTVSAVNPTLTLAALALRLGDHLAS
jgi:choline dehydrogenase-like flavoprotein